MTDELVRVESVSKIVRHRAILSDVSLSVSRSEVVGVIGPNGAGKTTLIRLLAGLSLPTQGSIRLNGSAPRHSEVVLGLVPESPGFVEHMNAYRNLALLASIRGRADREAVRASLIRCGLDPDDRRPVSKYSLGMRQRLALAQAIMEAPSVLVLDEPTNGLDVMGISDLRSLISEMASHGAAVLLCSHVLTEVELACDRVLMLINGRVVKELDTAELRRVAASVRLCVSGRSDWDVVSRLFAARRLIREDGLCGVLLTEQPIPEVIRTLVVNDVSIESIGPWSVSLEEEFFSTIGEGNVIGTS